MSGERHDRLPGDSDGTHRWTYRYGSIGEDVRPFVQHLASGEIVAGGAFVEVLNYGGATPLMATGRALYVLRFAAE